MEIPLQTDMLIVGAGPAGLAAAAQCQQADVDFLVVDAAPRVGGQLRQLTNSIEDYLGREASAGTAFAEHLRTQLKALERSICLSTRVRALRLNDGVATLASAGQPERVVKYKMVIVASGSDHRKLGIAGEEDPAVLDGWFSTSRDGSRFAGQQVVVVGGGDRALESAVHCADAGAKVTLLHRSAAFRAKTSFQQAVRDRAGIQVCMQSEVTAIQRLAPASVRQDDGNQLRLTVRDKAGRADRTIDCAALLVRIGMEPRLDLLRGQVGLTDDGVVEIDAFCETSMPGVFAIGDVAVPSYASSLQVSMGQGTLAGRCAIQRLQQGQGT